MYENRILPRSEYGSYVASLQGRCAFCNQRDLLLKDIGTWRWMWSKFPYQKYHTLLVPHRHVVSFSELTQNELGSLQQALVELRKIYEVAFPPTTSELESSNHMVYTWRERSVVGDDKKSVSHLHLHVHPMKEGDPSIKLDSEAWDIDRGVIESRL